MDAMVAGRQQSLKMPRLDAYAPAAPALSERGTIAVAAAAGPAPRTPEEEALAEIARAHALSDAWLKALEERAKAQWEQLVGGN